MTYQDYKSDLKGYADTEQIKDKPRRRMMLNNFTDTLHRDIDNRHQWSDAKKEQAKERLTNYCIKRHEK